MAHEAKKSVENTVFVRFNPPSAAVRRHHVEDIFSEIGPIKKSSVIHGGAKDGNVTSSYGFVKFLSQQDATLAAVQLNNRKIKVADGVSVTVSVEVAKTENLVPKSKRPAVSKALNADTGVESQIDESQRKKTNRLILRNLSFYAKEKDIRNTMRAFGELCEVHIPAVVGGGSRATHRGFCFVTFTTEKAVKKCLASKDPVVIRDRPVNIARSLHKTAHQARKDQTPPAPKSADGKPLKTKDKASLKGNDGGQKEASESDDSEDSSSDSESESEPELDDDNDESGSRQKKPNQSQNDRAAVGEKRCLFVRNLPFDCGRHDIFETFRQFGYITSIYIVKDRETGKVPKGTAFVSFQKPEQADRALQFASVSSNSFVNQKSATLEEKWENNHSTSTIGGIVLKGRRLLVDLAVDKETATTLTVTERRNGEGEGKDRRNLYLKGEGRVENDEKAGVLTWDEIPESDKVKRQTAWSEKNTKLRSPLFFINPNRLSLRNLAKHVDEIALKSLIVQATVKGLKNDLVSAKDQIAHWKSSGELTTRDIMARIQQAAAGGKSAKAVIPVFEEKNIKQSIPSLHIHRDFVAGANKKLAPSRGFGFVEFEHHTHALACLRELNNNTKYTAEYATGGKQAVEHKRRRMSKKKKIESDDVVVDDDGKVRLPRLIVEFTVENKAKAKQQAEHKAQQQENMIKQRFESKAKTGVEKHKEKKKKKSRGAKQREKKRKGVPEDFTSDVVQEERESVVVPTKAQDDTLKKKKRSIKPPKKKRAVDQAEANLNTLVESYKEQALQPSELSEGDARSKGKNKDKRWFE